MNKSNISSNFDEITSCLNISNLKTNDDFGMRILCLVFYPIVCNIGLITNSLTIAVLYKNRPWSVCDKTILAMSVMDVLAMIGVEARNGLRMALILQPDNEAYISTLVEKISLFLVISRPPIHLSKFFTALISFERFLAVYSPFKANTFWKKRCASLSVIGIFILLTAHLCLSSIVSRFEVTNSTLAWTRTEFAVNNHLFVMIYGGGSLILFNFPLVSVTIFTVATLICLWKRKQSFSCKQTSLQEKRVKVVRDTTKKLMVVTIVFIITELPSLLLLFVVTGSESRLPVNEVLNLSVLLVSLVNSSINGLFYVFWVKKFKKVCECGYKTRKFNVIYKSLR